MKKSSPGFCPRVRMGRSGWTRRGPAQHNMQTKQGLDNIFAIASHLRPICLRAQKMRPKIHKSLYCKDHNIFIQSENAMSVCHLCCHIIQDDFMICIFSRRCAIIIFVGRLEKIPWLSYEGGRLGMCAWSVLVHGWHHGRGQTHEYPGRWSLTWLEPVRNSKHLSNF